MKQAKRRQTSIKSRRTKSEKKDLAKARPFVEHLEELRHRLYFVILSIFLWGAATYAVQQHVVSLLLRPAHGEHFIYTSVGGGIDFLFKVCLYSGLILSLPIIVYNVLRFIEPVINRPSWRFVAMGSIISALLALCGVFFGYFVGLPAVLHFLLHQFKTVQIQPMVTIQAYLSFVIVYMVGSALMFQLPLILVFINRIKPLKPKQLLHYERWVILAAFVLSGLMNPTPNILSQLIIAVPFIITYHLGILIIALINRPSRHSLAERQAELKQRRIRLIVVLSRAIVKDTASVQPVYRANRANLKPLPRRGFMDYLPRDFLSGA